MGKDYEIIPMEPELDNGGVNKVCIGNPICCTIPNIICDCAVNSNCPGEWCYPNINICYERIGEVDI